jgi:hypothetical protein
VLWNLYLGSNSIDGAIPTTFGRCPSRAKVLVDLAGNEPDGLPSSLGRLADLTIYLRENQFTGVKHCARKQPGWMAESAGSAAMQSCNGTSISLAVKVLKLVNVSNVPKRRGWFW